MDKARDDDDDGRRDVVWKVMEMVLVLSSKRG